MHNNIGFRREIRVLTHHRVYAFTCIQHEVGVNFKYINRKTSCIVTVVWNSITATLYIIIIQVLWCSNINQYYTVGSITLSFLLQKSESEPESPKLFCFHADRLGPVGGRPILPEPPTRTGVLRDVKAMLPAAWGCDKGSTMRSSGVVPCANQSAVSSRRIRTYCAPG